MAGPGRLDELELSAEEAERLQRAFRDEKFRALFAEYAAELTDPEQRRLYEEEVAALERERGVEVRFVHPTPGYVLRTSQAGSRRCYLNICSNPHLGEPRARPEPGGQRWSLPYSLAPGREELGRGGHRRTVYDVVFHPAALRLAARSARFRRLLSDTALEAVERHCSVQLDRANAAVLRRAKYKGVPQAPVIRTPLPGGAPAPPAARDSPLPPFPAPPPPAAPPDSPLPPAGPTTPRWSIRHRSYVELQDYRCARDSAPSPVPRELVVTVELPLLRSAAQAELEIRGRELRLDSQRPAYRLRLRLPYDVDESGGRAAFNKAQRQLQVTLPVLQRPGPREHTGTGGERPEEPGAEDPAEPGAEGPAEPGAEDPAEPGAEDPAEPGAEGPAEPGAEDPAEPGAEGPAEPGAEDPAEPGAEPGAEDPAEPGAEGPAEPGAEDPAEPGAEGPAEPGAEDPAEPGAEDPAEPGAEDPAEPGAEGPAEPGAEDPAEPGAEDPAEPGAEGPAEPGAEDPAEPGAEPGAEDPAEPGAEDPAEPGAEEPVDPGADGPADPGSAPPPVPAEPPPPRSGAASPAASASPEPAMPSGAAPPCPPESPATGGSPGEVTVAWGSSSPGAAMCPPFQCRQDEASLTLLLHVPGIQPHSLSGDVGTNHYSLRFSTDTGTFTLFLQFPPATRLLSPETCVSVSAHNAVIALAKAAGSAGPWEKFCFGLDASALQERLFVSEENVDGFLGRVSCPSSCSQSALESQPLIEVLGVAEDRMQMRLQPQEAACSGQGGKQEELSSSGGDLAGETNGDNPQANAETNCPAAGADKGERAAETSRTSTSPPPAETIGEVGCSSQHCSQPEPSDTSSALPGERGRKEPGLEGAAAESEQAGGDGDGDGDGDRGVLRELNPWDGSVRILGDHTTRCPLAFQNPLLYELD